MIDARRRRKKLAKGVMRVFRDGVEERERLFADKSYAITREGYFVPFIPRHMTTDNWRELFWLQPRKLVIQGQVFKSLCSVCVNALDCLREKGSRKFDCKITPKTMTVELRRRRRKRR